MTCLGAPGGGVKDCEPLEGVKLEGGATFETPGYTTAPGGSAVGPCWIAYAGRGTPGIDGPPLISAPGGPNGALFCGVKTVCPSTITIVARVT
ncbi:hypothetical protein [Prosthecobacter sp.]|uniref:hypothetical protein n=1 Tax=Prosthecobacter sp. TaxID=1965333 RepID=UPI003782FC93